MSKELDRLSLHRSILMGKLAIPSNEATQRSLRNHLTRVEGHIEALLHPVSKAEREQDRLDEQQAAIWRQIHFNRRTHRPGNRELRKRLREVREGIEPWEPATWPPSKEFIDQTRARVQAIYEKYRVPDERNREGIGSALVAGLGYQQEDGEDHGPSGLSRPCPGTFHPSKTSYSGFFTRWRRERSNVVRVRQDDPGEYRDDCKQERLGFDGRQGGTAELPKGKSTIRLVPCPSCGGSTFDDGTGPWTVSLRRCNPGGEAVIVICARCHALVELTPLRPGSLTYTICRDCEQILNESGNIAGG